MFDSTVDTHLVTLQHHLVFGVRYPLEVLLEPVALVALVLEVDGGAAVDVARLGDGQFGVGRALVGVVSEKMAAVF